MEKIFSSLFFSCVFSCSLVSLVRFIVLMLV